jgi:hypothetical protein
MRLVAPWQDAIQLKKLTLFLAPTTEKAYEIRPIFSG